MAEKSKHTGNDPAEAADNPVEAMMKDVADIVPDGTGDLNETDDRVEVHASISEGMNSEKTSGGAGAAGSAGEGRKP